MSPNKNQLFREAFSGQVKLFLRPKSKEKRGRILSCRSSSNSIAITIQQTITRRLVFIPRAFQIKISECKNTKTKYDKTKKPGGRNGRKKMKRFFFFSKTRKNKTNPENSQFVLPVFGLFIFLFRRQSASETRTSDDFIRFSHLHKRERERKRKETNYPTTIVGIVAMNSFCIFICIFTKKYGIISIYKRVKANVHWRAPATVSSLKVFQLISDGQCRHYFYLFTIYR